MEKTRCIWPIVAAGAAFALTAIGCRTSVAGEYELDFEETKKAVDISAAEHPEEANMKEATLKMLSATRLTMTFADDGKLTSVASLSMPGAPPGETKQTGTWKLDQGRVVIKAGDSDTVCEVDGKRLRCGKDTYNKLQGRYVLRRK